MNHSDKFKFSWTVSEPDGKACAGGCGAGRISPPGFHDPLVRLRQITFLPHPGISPFKGQMHRGALGGSRNALKKGGASRHPTSLPELQYRKDPGGNAIGMAACFVWIIVRYSGAGPSFMVTTKKEVADGREKRGHREGAWSAVLRMRASPRRRPSKPSGRTWRRGGRITNGRSGRASI